jgi:hypothetical protein
VQSNYKFYFTFFNWKLPAQIKVNNEFRKIPFHVVLNNEFRKIPFHVVFSLSYRCIFRVLVVLSMHFQSSSGDSYKNIYSGVGICNMCKKILYLEELNCEMNFVLQFIS